MFHLQVLLIKSFISSKSYVMQLSVESGDLGGENGQFRHNRASNGLTGNENFTKGHNWDPN
jgi:hypothetical protein